MVLFLDVIRPLRFPMNVLNRVVLWAIAYSPFVQDAKRRQLAWESRFAALISGRARLDRSAPGVAGRAPTELAARGARNEPRLHELDDIGREPRVGQSAS